MRDVWASTALSPACFFVQLLGVGDAIGSKNARPTALSPAFFEVQLLGVWDTIGKFPIEIAQSRKCKIAHNVLFRVIAKKKFLLEVPRADGLRRHFQLRGVWSAKIGVLPRFAAFPRNIEVDFGPMLGFQRQLRGVWGVTFRELSGHFSRVVSVSRCVSGGWMLPFFAFLGVGCCPFLRSRGLDAALFSVLGCVMLHPLVFGALFPRSFRSFRSFPHFFIDYDQNFFDNRSFFYTQR